MIPSTASRIPKFTAQSSRFNMPNATIPLNIKRAVRMAPISEYGVLASRPYKLSAKLCIIIPPINAIGVISPNTIKIQENILIHNGMSAFLLLLPSFKKESDKMSFWGSIIRFV